MTFNIKILLVLSLFVQTISFQNEKPNIVLIVADDFGYSDVSSFGSKISIPNIDNLDEFGVMASFKVKGIDIGTSFISPLKLNTSNIIKEASTLNLSKDSVYLDNGILIVKLDITRGGAISYISKSNEKRNLINIYDEGRYVQQSYYAGKRLNRISDGQSKNWSPWTWNPIQVGDAFRNRAQILEYKKTGNSLYVKCVPMLWDMNNTPAEAIMEQWTKLEGNIIKVSNKLTCNRTDTIYGEGISKDQELPAVYPISALKNLYSYFGDKPFTNDVLNNPKVEHLEDGFWGRYKDHKVSEHWMAFVDDNNWGIGVYTPIATNFLAGMAGVPGFESTDSQTSYIAPIKKVALKKKDIFEYDYYLIIGTLKNIRENVYKIEEKLK